MKAGDATPTRAARCDLRASLEPVPPLAVLAHEWLGLESRAQSSFFTAWPWIGHWLARLPASVATELLRVRAQGRTVGLAIVCRRDQVRRALPGKSRALYVNCTGDPALDELTIEYNGLLAETGREAEVLQAAIVALAQDASWDELFLDGWEHAAQLGDPLRVEPGMRWVERSRRVCHYVDLAALPNRGRDYLAAPPRKARYKLRRAWREAEALGGPALDIAANPAQASAFLDELARLHQATWVGRGQAGAFANPFFRAFHTALVASGSEHVQLARLRVGDRPVGYLYNFIHRGRAYNYQSGFDLGSRPAPAGDPACSAMRSRSRTASAWGCAPTNSWPATSTTNRNSPPTRRRWCGPRCNATAPGSAWSPRCGRSGRGGAGPWTGWRVGRPGPARHPSRTCALNVMPWSLVNAPRAQRVLGRTRPQGHARPSRQNGVCPNAARNRFLT